MPPATSLEGQQPGVTQAGVSLSASLRHAEDGALAIEAELRVGKGGGGAFTDLVLVLDKSFSMHEHDQLEVAKRAIEVVLSHFSGPWDRLCLLAFDADVEVVFALGPLGDERKEELLRKVKAIRLGTTTNIQDALEEALEQLDRRTPEEKQARVGSVLLLTDGSHNESKFTYEAADRLYRDSQTSGVYCLAVGHEADQPFLFDLSERYKGQAAYIDNRKDKELNTAITGTFFRFFGALSSVNARDCTLSIHPAPTSTTPMGHIDVAHSDIAAGFQPALQTDGSVTMALGSLMSEQVIHLNMRYILAPRPEGSAPPTAGTSLGEMVLEYVDTRSKEKKRLSTALRLPPLISSTPGAVVIEKLEGSVSLDGAPAENAQTYVLDGSGKQLHLTTNPTSHARMYIGRHVLLEPSARSSMHLSAPVDTTGERVLTIVMESGRLYVESPRAAIEARKVPGVHGHVEVRVKIPQADTPLPRPPTTAAPSPPRRPLAQATASSRSIPPHDASSAPAPHTSSLSRLPTNRVFIDMSSSPSDVRIASLGGNVTIEDSNTENGPCPVPMLSEVVMPKRAGGAGAQSNDLQPAPQGKRSILDDLSIPAFVSELHRTTRTGEREALTVLRGLIARERELLTQQRRAPRIIEQALQPVMAGLIASLPRAFESSMSQAYEKEGDVDLSGITVNQAALEFVSFQRTVRLIEELQRIIELARSDPDMTLILGAIRQLAQVLDQERATMDGPNSINYVTHSQRSHMVAGFEKMGEAMHVELRHIAERYKQAFGEDFDKLIEQFDGLKEMKRNQWGIPIGMVKNRVDVFSKRAAAHSPQPPTTGAGLVKPHGKV